MSSKPEKSDTSHISVQEFTEATFTAVMRAMDARNAARIVPGAKEDFKIGPIIYGIVAWPDGDGFPQLQGPQGAKGAERP
jgi:hypothetical protein